MSPAGGATQVGPVHAMSIDVEEHFQVWALRHHYGRDAWPGLPSRVEANTERLLELMDATGTRATFFTLGWVAERHPALVRRIVERGHELASHGQDHRLVYEQSEDEFREDVRQSKAVLEDIAGVAVRGYRAANFSIDKRTPWAHAALAEAGYRYSSSSHPVRNDHYGESGGAPVPHERDGIVELPVTTLALAGMRLPCAGGGYFRLLPYGWTRLALARAAATDETPMIFYLHPWEVDPGQPRPPRLDLKTRIRHYTSLSRCADRLADLMRRFRWGRIDEAFADRLAA